MTASALGLRVAVSPVAGAQALVDYLNAANVVARYAASVNATTLPTLVTPPDGYAEYADTMATAKLHAMAWIDEMLPQFTAVPRAIREYNGLVGPQLHAMGEALTVLAEDQDDSAARQSVEAAIAKLQQQTAPVASALGDLDDWIEQYSATLAPDAGALSSLCAGIATAEQADQAAIDKLKEVLGTFQALVAERNELATLDSIGNWAFSVFLAVAGVGVGAPFTAGAAIIVGLLVGIASATYTSFEPIVSPPDYQQSLAELQSTMNNVNSEIGAVNTIVGLLQATAEQLSALVTAASEVSTAAASVLAFWQQVQADLAATAADLNRILADVLAGSADEALDNLAAARASWDALEAAVAPLAAASYSVNPVVQRPPLQPA